MPSKRALASIEPDQEPVDVLDFTASNPNPNRQHQTQSSSSSLTATSNHHLSTSSSRSSIFEFGSESIKALGTSISRVFSRPSKKQRTELPESMNGKEKQLPQSSPPSSSTSNTNSTPNLYPKLPQSENQSLYPTIPNGNSKQAEFLSADDSARHIALLDSPSCSSPSSSLKPSVATPSQNQEQLDAEEIADILDPQPPSSSPTSSIQKDQEELDQATPSAATPAKNGKKAHKRKRKGKKRKNKNKESDSNQNGNGNGSGKASEEKDGEDLVAEKESTGKGLETDHANGELQEEEFDINSTRLARSTQLDFLQESALADASTIAIAPRSEDGEVSVEEPEPEVQLSTPTASNETKEEVEELNELDMGEQKELIEKEVDQEEETDLRLEPAKIGSLATDEKIELQNSLQHADSGEPESTISQDLTSHSATSSDLKRQGSLEPEIEEDDEDEEDLIKASSEIRFDTDEPLDLEDDEKIIIDIKSSSTIPMILEGRDSPSDSNEINNEDQVSEEEEIIEEDKENKPPISKPSSGSFNPVGAPVVDLTGSDDDDEEEEDIQMNFNHQTPRNESSPRHTPTSARLTRPSGLLETEISSGLSGISLSRKAIQGGTFTPSLFSTTSSAMKGISGFSDGQRSFAPSVASVSTTTGSWKKKNPIGWADHQKKVKSHNNNQNSQKFEKAFKLRNYNLKRRLKTASNRADFQSMIQLGGIATKVIAQADGTFQKKVGKAFQIEADEFYTNNYLERIYQKEQRSSKSVLPLPQRKLDEFERLEKERKLRAKKARGVLGRQPLPSKLSEDQESEVQDIFKRRGKISTIPGAEVAEQDIVKLKPRQWLNDEVINFYGILILNRADQAEKARKEALNKGEKWNESLNAFWRVHYFSSFFFSRLCDQGYESVRRWSKKVDLFTRDIVLIPINLGNSHWVCGAINIRRKRFEYYDSLSSSNSNVFKILRNYLIEEAKDKKKGSLDLSDWKDYFNPENPSQENGFDCGVFASITLEQISRRDPFTKIPEPLSWNDEKGTIVGWNQDDFNNVDDEEEEDQDWNFSQENMPFLRRRMTYEIVNKALLETT